MIWLEAEGDTAVPEYTAEHQGTRYTLKERAEGEGFCLYERRRKRRGRPPQGDVLCAGPFTEVIDHQVGGYTFKQLEVPMSSDAAIARASEWVRQRVRWARVRTPRKFRCGRARR